MPKTMPEDRSSKAATSSESATKIPGREGKVTLPYPVLNKINYGAWAVRVKLLMRAQGHVGCG